MVPFLLYAYSSILCSAPTPRGAIRCVCIIRIKQLKLMLATIAYRSSSPGKLLHFLVDDGSHVSANQHYAEIEVMKMVTYLTTTETGMYVLSPLPPPPPLPPHMTWLVLRCPPPSKPCILTASLTQAHFTCTCMSTFF